MAIKVITHKTYKNKRVVNISIVDNGKRIYNRRDLRLKLTEDGEIDFEDFKKRWRNV